MRCIPGADFTSGTSLMYSDDIIPVLHVGKKTQHVLSSGATTALLSPLLLLLAAGGAALGNRIAGSRWGRGDRDRGLVHPQIRRRLPHQSLCFNVHHQVAQLHIHIDASGSNRSRNLYRHSATRKSPAVVQCFGCPGHTLRTEDYLPGLSGPAAQHLWMKSLQRWLQHPPASSPSAPAGCYAWIYSAAPKHLVPWQPGSTWWMFCPAKQRRLQK